MLFSQLECRSHKQPTARSHSFDWLSRAAIQPQKTTTIPARAVAKGKKAAANVAAVVKAVATAAAKAEATAAAKAEVEIAAIAADLRRPSRPRHPHLQ